MTESGNPADQPLIPTALETKLKQLDALPSPPGVASQLVEMSQDPSIGMAEVAAVVELDPAVTVKILKTANSPAFCRQNTVENLTQAVTLLGLNETLSMALSFSLVNSLHASNQTGLDYPMFWRRSLGVATFARVLARLSKTGDLDRYFLCGLLQDIGMLVIDKSFPNVYEGIGAVQSDHASLCRRETSALQCDHSAIGAWLFEQWAFPEHFRYATLSSHDPNAAEFPGELTTLVRHLHVAQLVGDLWWRRDWGDCARRGAKLSESLLGIPQDTFLEAMTTHAELLFETAAVFDIPLGDRSAIDKIVEQAAEVLESDSLHGAREAMVELAEVKQDDDQSERIDELTGLYSRAHIEQLKDLAFNGAKRSKTPLSLICIELDRFEQLETQLGRQTDTLVKLIGAALEKAARKTDIIGRYDTHRFVLYLPSTPAEGAEIFANRLSGVLQRIGAAPSLSKFAVTASLGVASSMLAKVDCGSTLLATGLQALEQASAGGGDRVVVASQATEALEFDDDDELEFSIEPEPAAAPERAVIQLA